jgi:acylphosphatase
MPTTKLVIYGQVQGVGFRYWLKGKFRELEIEGGVWNNTDGTVGVEFSANEAKTRKILAYLKLGPPLAKIKKVAIL